MRHYQQDSNFPSGLRFAERVFSLIPPVLLFIPFVAHYVYTQDNTPEQRKR